MSIASAILSKMALFQNLQSANVNLMELWCEAEKAGPSQVWKKGYVNAGDLREWKKAGACHEGVDFLNTLKHRIEETAHASLDDGFQFSSARWHALEWNKRRSAA